jgi:hypothetical protein
MQNCYCNKIIVQIKIKCVRQLWGNDVKDFYKKCMGESFIKSNFLFESTLKFKVQY